MRKRIVAIRAAQDLKQVSHNQPPAEFPSPANRRGWLAAIAAALAVIAGLACPVGAPAVGADFEGPAAMAPSAPARPIAPAPSLETAALTLSAPSAPTDYVIGPLDKISVKVFKVPDLSEDSVLVDANGQVTMPLIGDVTAAGKTSQQLADLIAGELGAQYLQNPQVSVAIVDSASRKVTVEGEVKTPGVYAMKGRMTLMQTIAMAGGFADDADYKKIAVIRSVDGVRKVAICNYDDIRLTRTPDPEINGDDVVVVDGSHGKMAWSAVLKSLPLFSLLAIAL